MTLSIPRAAFETMRVINDRTHSTNDYNHWESNDIWSKVFFQIVATVCSSIYSFIHEIDGIYVVNEISTITTYSQPTYVDVFH